MVAGESKAEEAMSEQKHELPAAMVDAAAKAIRDYQRRLEFADDFSDSSAAEAALRAAGVPALAEDAATFRHLLNIAQQVYGFEMIGDAFTKIDNLRADVKLLREGIEEWREWIMSLPINRHCSRLSTAKGNVEQQAARIAELEAALSLAIPRMEHLQSLLSCGESVQFCNDFDEQKGKEVAEEVERLKRIMQK